MSRSSYDKLHRSFGQTLSESEISARSGELINLDRFIWTTQVASSPCEALKKTRVAIVGGGFAGMMAAWSLCQREIEVVVFEAGKDVGGRVRSDKEFANGRVIEFGAELVGANHPLWLTLAGDLGIGLMTRTSEAHYALLKLEMKHRINGRDINPDIGKGLEERIRKEILVEIGKDAMKIKNPAKPWLDNSNRTFDNMSVEDKLTKRPPIGLGLSKNDLVYESMKLTLENNLVTPLAQMNYLGLLCLVKAGRFGTDKDKKDNPDPNLSLDKSDSTLLGFWDVTEEFRCTDGCQSLVKRMVERLTDKKQNYKFKLLVNAKVKKITFDLTAPIKPRPAVLEWEPSVATLLRRVDPNFDYVILATPPSVWDEITITPEHPKDKVGPIQMGPAIKFFSGFTDRFWIGEKAAPSGVSSDIGMIWEGTDNQTLIDKQEIVLSVFAGGLAKTGRRLKEAELTKELTKLYRGYGKYNQRKKAKLQDWFDEKFIRTGYSCPKPGDIFKSAAQLQASFASGHLFLAGEYTQTNFFGFMEGALQSGRRVAEALIAEACPQTRTA